MARSSQGAITSKALVHAAGVIGSRAMRPPLIEATDDEVAVLQAALATSGLTS
jgi:4-hydroxy-tetrahydrodipicolinate synthase